MTAGLNTFGARIPRNLLALALIDLAGVPVAAPSANASTKPSPTAAEHVAYDLDGRIETIIDGGPCDVGVESTVVDGLSHPPLILRPGGISIEQLRSCPGWENTQIGYKNVSEAGTQPKAPGMKYRHYSPNATVVLYESGRSPPSLADLLGFAGQFHKIGVITTKCWVIDPVSVPPSIRERPEVHRKTSYKQSDREGRGFAGMLDTLNSTPDVKAVLTSHDRVNDGTNLSVSEVALGTETADLARGVFSALRLLDRENVDAIFVEGIDEYEGDTAAAVVNRLRKAAEVKIG